MELKTIKLKNFRSCDDLTVHLNPNCRGLIGVNESGKTSILRALSLLDSEVQLSHDDVRETADHSVSVKESNVSFIFGLTSEERKTLSNDFQKIFSPDHRDEEILVSAERSLAVKDIGSLCTEIIYNVDLIKKKRYFTAVGWLSSYNLKPGWKTHDKNFTSKQQNREKQAPEFFAVKVSEGKNLLLGEMMNSVFYLKELTIQELSNELNSILLRFLNAALPEVIYWTYSESNLLPSRINIDAFKENPDSCIPLKNIFNLAKVDDVGGAIEQARPKSSTMRNLLTRVSSAATAHLKEVWPEFKNIEIQLIQNGDFIEAGVQDSISFFTFEQRSEGFKRFITFLLLISARARFQSLKNAVIILDEPDLGLHPSGARNLLGELIRLSKENKIIFSTHSIFMIDRDQVSRHLIVKRENERTSIVDADKSDLQDEEVLYRALGYSIFETLKQRNLIFEGWRDKHLFKIALNSEGISEELRRHFSDFGLCHARGVKDIPNMMPLFESASRDCYVISDCDKPAKEQKRKHEGAKSHGFWLTYEDVLGNDQIYTAEDFIRKEYFTDVFAFIRSTYPAVQAGNPEDLPDSKKLPWIEKKFEEAHIVGDEKQRGMNQIKELLANNLTCQDLNVSATRFINNLATMTGFNEK